MLTMASPTQSDHMADDCQFPLPGFRFHPTDEELVDFYLRRKVHNKPLAIELIKQINIYKYSPWDLPHASNALGDKEWYFFCKRGRKYKNSVRPNRVTGSGFWKATGIDKPIYAHGGHSHRCIGLKKTLVYYRGSAGKGTKTEWMMNEFRLPSSTSSSNDPLRRIIKNNLEEAEIWTLCRIFKRNVSTRKAINTPNWREVPAAKSRAMENMNFRTTTNNIDIDRYSDDNEQSSYISFASNNSFIGFDHVNEVPNSDQIQMPHGGRFMTNFCGPTEPLAPSVDPNSSANVSPSSSSFSDFDEDATDLFGYEKWEELKSILESDLDS